MSTEAWAEQNGIYHDIDGVPWRRSLLCEGVWERWSDCSNEYVDAGRQPLAEALLEQLSLAVALLEQIRDTPPPKEITIDGHTWTHQPAKDDFPACWYCDTIHEAHRHDGEPPQREVYEEGDRYYDALEMAWRLLGS